MPSSKAKSYAAQTATSALAPFEIARREPGPRDVEIEVLFCGVVLRIPAGLDPAAAAPLLCAGITTYSPLQPMASLESAAA
jgi:D-arabinose 1-dehydrogenase-like Zn-dependent alcohol dehydrogenase